MSYHLIKKYADENIVEYLFQDRLCPSEQKFRYNFEQIYDYIYVYGFIPDFRCVVFYKQNKKLIVDAERTKYLCNFRNKVRSDMNHHLYGTKFSVKGYIRNYYSKILEHIVDTIYMSNGYCLDIARVLINKYLRGNYIFKLEINSVYNTNVKVIFEEQKHYYNLYELNI